MDDKIDPQIVSLAKKVSAPLRNFSPPAANRRMKYLIYEEAVCACSIYCDIAKVGQDVTVLRGII